MRVVPTKKYMRQAERMPSNLYRKLQERVTLFARQPFHPLLDNHPLSGSWRGYRSINITGDWRVVYEQVGTDIARLIEVGTHHNLYGT
ncbi:MAG: type II toxin-antitoxin system RelE/ParE family toxin [Patescibacteria group bacterium]